VPTTSDTFGPLYPSQLRFTRSALQRQRGWRIMPRERPGPITVGGFTPIVPIVPEPMVGQVEQAERPIDPVSWSTLMERTGAQVATDLSRNAFERPLDLAFLTPRSDELLGRVTNLHQDDPWFVQRAHLIDRPVYIRRLRTLPSGRSSCVIRAIVRREELIPPVTLGTHGHRELEIRNCTYVTMEMEEREGAYTAWLRSTRPGYGELSPDFVFNVHADDETPKVKRKKKTVFRGVWGVRTDMTSRENDVYLFYEHLPWEHGITVRMYLVNGRGNRIPGGEILDIGGPMEMDGRHRGGVVSVHAGFDGQGLFSIENDGCVTVIRDNEDDADDPS